MFSEPLKHDFTNTEEFCNSRFKVIAPEGVTLSDLFIPVFWANARSRLREHDIVRVVATDDSFDVDLTVIEITKNGAQMRFKEKLPENLTLDSGVEVPRDSLGRPAIRAEFLPGSRWRLIGLSGEVLRGMSAPEAHAELTQYLKDAGLPPPPPLSVSLKEPE